MGKGPAVIFSGHPTLEMGESRDLCSKWLESDQHKIIITEPDLPPTIFQDRRSTVLYWPIDTRLTQSAARMLIEELEPKEVIISDIMRKNCPTLAESGFVKVSSVGPMKTYDTELDRDSTVLVNIEPKLASQIQMKTHIDPLTGPPQLCQISGLLQVTNNKYSLSEVGNTSLIGNSRQKVFGKSISEEILLVNLNAIGIKDVMLRKSEVQI